MGTPCGPVQAAIDDVLADDAAVMGLVPAVLDGVPPRSAYPAGDGRGPARTLDRWSHRRGFSALGPPPGRVVALLDGRPLHVDRCHHVAPRDAFGPTLRDPTPHLLRTVLGFRVVTEQLICPRP